MSTIWIDPVYDRAAANIVYGDSKGCLDAAVLNRIENNVQYITDAFIADHIPCVTTRQKDEWSRTDYIKLTPFNAIKQNIMNIRNTGYCYTTTPTLSMSVAGALLSYQELNNMEKILFDAKQLLDGAKGMQRKLGTFSAGSSYQRQYIRSV